MGWEIMGTEHLKPRDTTVLSDEEMAEAAIDFIENAGYPLLPWQATTLRAMLLYPVGTRFMVAPPPQHPQRRGFESTQVLIDEAAPKRNVSRDCECPYGATNPRCIVHGDGRRY
jgi:hypothetical protein